MKKIICSNGKTGELSCIHRIIVNKVSNEDYDRFDDIITGPPGSMDYTVVN
jgi:hypothetical protein